MKIKTLFENYRDNKIQVIICENEIEQRRLEILPSNTPYLSLTPKGTGMDSSVERTLLKIQRDPVINKWQRIMENSIREINTVDQLLELTEEPVKTFLTEKYIKGHRVSDIADNAHVTTREVYRQFKRVFERYRQAY